MNAEALEMLPRVLLVEDSLPVRQRLHSLIAESGRARVVAEASTVQAALEAFERHAPDAVVLDLQLADGSGCEALEAMKFLRPDCCVVVMTNFALPEMRERCLLLGADHVLEKSTDFERVPDLVGHPLAPAPAPGMVSPTPRQAVFSASAGLEQAHSPHHFRHLVESIDAAVYTCDGQGRFSFYNAAAARLWGREPVLGIDLWCGAQQLFDTGGQTLPSGQGPMALTIRNGQAVRGHEVVVQRPDGTLCHVLQHPQPLFDASGALTGAVNLMVDITPLRLAEASRLQAQLMAQATLDSLSANICVLDAQGSILATNLAWRHFGQANQAIPSGVNLGANYLAACDAGARAASPGAAEFAAGLRAVLDGSIDHFTAEYACHSPDKQRWFTAGVRPLRGSQPLRLVVSHTDITTRKLAELGLTESEQRWKKAVEGSGDGVWDLDLATNRCSYSRRWKEMLGHEAHEIGDSVDEWSSRIHPDELDMVMAQDLACRKGDAASINCEMRMRCKDGSWKWILDRGAVVHRDANGAPLRMVGTHSDIDDRKRDELTRAALETHLREAQKIEVVGMLASSIAHDFNNIMGAVLGNVSLALEDVAPAHGAYRHLEQIQRAGLRARRLVQRILAINRRQPPAMLNQWLHPLMEDEIELLRATLPSGVSVEPRLCEQPLSARVDAGQLSQVLLNLGTNAWHALQGRPGTLQIGLDRADPWADGRAGAHEHAAASHAHLWVRDTGSGMDQATQSRMFEAFFTTKAGVQGTGLGLAAVQRIVQGHDGRIEVESAPGQGSCIHLFLPLTSAPDDTEATDHHKLPTTLDMVNSGHVMYIDDDETMSVLVSALLPRAGLQVSCFKDADVALAALRASPHTFDLIVTDYNMPRQTGLDVAQAATKIRPDMPMVLTSGYFTDDMVEGAHMAGIRGLVQKERTFEDLCDEIRRVLTEARAAL